MSNKDKLKELPSVDEILKSPQGEAWLSGYPRRYVLQAVRDIISERRNVILAGKKAGTTLEYMKDDIEKTLAVLTSLSLKKVINATGIVIHTNLGRSALSSRAIENISDAASGYSNLEYSISEGVRGKRYAHIKRLLRDVTGAEDGIAVNNNAGAVLLTLNALAKGKEVIVSRGELVEIGGSFRIPDVMAQSGAILREVGTTNKTHLKDYEKAITENTALILKVHQSNYRITGFTKDVPIEKLVELGAKENIPVMYDLGSGCLIDLRPFGIRGEPSVSEIVKTGTDILTFSGDKLLGGPQAGIIVGKKEIIEKLQNIPLLRALRIDKLTLAALEATLMEYIDEEKAIIEIPTLRMLTEKPDIVKKRAKKIAEMISKAGVEADISVIEEAAFAGGGSLPEQSLKTFAVAIKLKGKLTPDKLEKRLRFSNPPVIARIKEDTLLLDARTISEEEIKTLADCVIAAIKG